LSKEEKQNQKRAEALKAYTDVLLAKSKESSSSSTSEPPPPPPSCDATAGSCGMVSPPPTGCVAAAGNRGRKKKNTGGGESDSSDDVIWVERKFEDHKKPPCDACGAPVSWKLQEHVDTLVDTLKCGKQVFCRYYYCAACKAKAWGCTEGEALKRIIEEKPSFRK
jgi:hypothetical protein